MSKIKQHVRTIDNTPFVTIGLVIVNLLVFVWLTFAGGTTNPTVLITHGAMVPMLVKEGTAIWTIFTAMFIHIGFQHILFNMITLYFLGRLLERLIGHLKFIVIYLISGVLANVISLSFSAPNTISAGASGAIFGIIGVWLMLAEQYRHFPFLKDMGRQMLLFTVIGILSGFFGTNVNIFAHISGLIVGMLSAYAIGFPQFGKIPQWKRISSIILIVVIMTLFTKLAFTS